MSKARILLTGCNGFIGKNFIKNYKDVYDIVGVDYSGQCESGVEFYSMDFELFCEQTDLSQFDGIVHLAATSRVPACEDDPSGSYNNNVTKSCKLINKLIAGDSSKVNRMIPFFFASSSAVYGNTFSRQSTHNLDLAYAKQKAYVEDYIMESKEVPNSNLVFGLGRIFNVFGDGQTGNHMTLVSAWLDKIKNQSPILFEGSGSQRRDWVHVDQVCLMIHRFLFEWITMEQDELEKVLTVDTHQYEVFDIGTGISRSNLEMLEIMVKQMAGVTGSKLALNFMPARQNDVMITQAGLATPFYNKQSIHSYPLCDDLLEHYISDWFKENME